MGKNYGLLPHFETFYLPKFMIPMTMVTGYSDYPTQVTGLR